MSSPELHPLPHRRISSRTIFGYPRDFLGNDFVYLTVSPSARGLAIGINVLPDPPARPMDLPTLAVELQRTLTLVQSGELAALPGWSGLRPELRQLRHVAISGDAEPSRAPHFAATIETVTHLRAVRQADFFMIVLVTDGSRLRVGPVRQGLRLLTGYDEVWGQLDVLRSPGPGRVLHNVSRVGQERPIVVQSICSSMDGVGSPPEETERYLERLHRLLEAGTQIARVQLYSASGSQLSAAERPLPLAGLSALAERVRAATQLPVEVF